MPRGRLILRTASQNETERAGSAAPARLDALTLHRLRRGSGANTLLSCGAAVRRPLTLFPECRIAWSPYGSTRGE